MAAKKKRAGSVRRGPGSNTARKRKASVTKKQQQGPKKAHGRKVGKRPVRTSKPATGKIPFSKTEDASVESSKVDGSEAASGSLWGKVLEKVAQDDVGSDQGLVRLNAYLARCGVASRRKSDELISSGRIVIDGKVVRELGFKLDPLRSMVRIDGELLKPEPPTYVLLNKPKNVVCTSSIHEQKLRAIDLLTGVKGRLYTVGRLDADSEGLLLLTNDGAFADRMTHPRYEVPKTYHVVVRGRVEKDKLDKVRGGVWLSEGRVEGFQIRIKKRGQERSILEVTIREGRNREIRRVFARVGHPVLRLSRVKMGNLTLRGVGTGKWRFLRPPEVADLLKGSYNAETATN